MDTILLTPEGNLLNYSNPEIVINIIVGLVIGIMLSVVYRFTHSGLSYSQSFAQTIVFVTMIVALVMMVIGGSLARAFALVGALSIIRFLPVPSLGRCNPIYLSPDFPLCILLILSNLFCSPLV